MDEHFSQYEYRTGSTEPKKSRSGLIAFLLILVIFFSGVICAMGLMNIRLSLWLGKASPASTPLSFSQGSGDGAQVQIPDSAEQSVELEGMKCQELSVLCQTMYGLPEGLFISDVADGSRADLLGIAPGDVLMSFAGTPVSRLDALQGLLDAHASGTQVDIVTYRRGQQNRLTLMLDD